MEIYLAHPGENDGQNLTERGVWQMNALARRLRMERVSVGKVYANGHLVSAQSGDILSRTLRVPLVRDERFVEFDFGSLIANPFSVDNDNIESIHVFVDELVRRGEDAIIAMDGGIHRAVISRLTGLSLEDTKHFDLSPASLSVLQYASMNGTRGWRIASVNDTAHLHVP